jgi:peptidoglycan/LPS O-acetylase OafA/YrhL
VADSRRTGNARAGWSIVLGLLSVGTVPAAVFATRYSETYELLHAGFSIPVAALLGVGALVLTRAARRRNERTLGRAGGLRAAAWGRALAVLGLSIAASAAIAVGVYGLLSYLETR